MIAEFSIVPIGAGESVSMYVAECLKIVRASGLKYEFTALATILEGEYDEVMEVIGRCHKKVRSMTGRVMTTVRIDDRQGAVNEIERKVRSVEEKVIE
ncbi:MAG: MTH1187 family thiamine-binding protein [Methanomassiliicoccus sp.]|nr:MTH1187 family thiamine-binding protein [Methanomassiliicoccus sp.]